MCTTVIVGKAVSATGSVLVGHNEDAGGRMVPQQFFCPGGARPVGAVLTAEPGRAVLPDVPQVLDTFWCNMMAPAPGSSFDQGMANGAGLVLCSNGGGTSYEGEKSDEALGLKDGGIGFLFRRTVMERAHSAREAVRIAAALIDEYGYFGIARNYTFADADEAWVMNVVKGRHYVARRIPDDKVVLISNSLSIRTVDLTDTDNTAASPDLIEHAVKEGHYRPAREGDFSDFDFARAYQSDDNRRDPNKSVRMRTGWEALTGTVYEDELDYPEMLTPAKPVSPADIRRILRLSDPQSILTRSDGQADAFHVSARDICRSHTRLSWVAALSPDPMTLTFWNCIGPTETGLFVPWFPFTGRLPADAAVMTLPEARRFHFDADPDALSFGSTEDRPSRYAAAAVLSEVVNFDRAYLAGVRPVQAQLEAGFEARLKTLFARLPEERGARAEALVKAMNVMQEEADESRNALLDEIAPDFARVIRRRKTSASGEVLIEIAVESTPDFNAANIDPKSVCWGLGFTSSKASALAPAKPLDFEYRETEEGDIEAVFTFRAADVEPHMVKGVLHDSYLRGLARCRRFVTTVPVKLPD